MSRPDRRHGYCGRSRCVRPSGRYHTMLQYLMHGVLRFCWLQTWLFTAPTYLDRGSISSRLNKLSLAVAAALDSRAEHLQLFCTHIRLSGCLCMPLVTGTSVFTAAYPCLQLRICVHGCISVPVSAYILIFEAALLCLQLHIDIY